MHRRGGLGCAGFWPASRSRAIAKNKLDIVVVGSASSELNGPAGTNIAYPTWLEKTLRGLLPGVTVKVTTYARARDTASEMEPSLRASSPNPHLHW